MKSLEPLARLQGKFTLLPGVGLKTAQRYALAILKMTDAEVKDFAATLVGAKKDVRFCIHCGGFSEKEVCGICAARSGNVICVVKDAKDVLVMEKVRDYQGVYHVLGGVLNPMENVNPNDLRIRELLARLNENVSEVILALNPDVEGEATAMYLARLIKPLGIKVSRIATGISMGSDLEYADEVTLSKAIEDRKML